MLNSNNSNISISSFDLFRWKVELLCNGFIIPSSILPLLESNNISLAGGRKTGAGPAGGRYFLLPNESLINLQIWIDYHPPNRFILDGIDSNRHFIIIDKENILPPVDLRLLNIPSYYRLLSKEKIPFQKIAVMHGDQTIATTINQRCHLWRTHEECKFCAIEFALDAGTTIEKKSSFQIVEAITAAKNENPLYASHLTLTTGNFSTEEELIGNYSQIISDLKGVFPDMTIHLQTEPLKNIEGIKILKQAGADTIGIHLEVLDEEIRKKICPGKSKIPLELYYKNWEAAIEVFGKNQVSTFILTGFEENPIVFDQILVEIIKKGVIPIITPARHIAGVATIIPSTQSKKMIDILIHAAQLCLEYGVDPIQNKAGCVRCGGCSAIIDAYLLVKSGEQFIL
jgi:radical SAM protein (TIGR04043 family)